MARSPTALPPPLHATSGSWINQVERWLAELTRRQLHRDVHTSTNELEQDIRSFIERPPRTSGNGPAYQQEL
jgi:hypothetical protein